MGKKKIILSVVGARPNIMKIAPLNREILKVNNFEHLILHTGQHYDDMMSDIFFKEFNLQEPNYKLNVGSASHAVQTAKIMSGFEKVVSKVKPDMVVVVGDVNSTLACSIVAKKLGIPVAHIESGLRSFDRTMPEEINRIVTDSISDYLFVSEESGLINLQNEGIKNEKVYFVGNIMIDSLVSITKELKKSEAVNKFSLNGSDYIVVTLHRPSNVDNLRNSKNIVEMLNLLSKQTKIIFPIHPRTRKMFESFDLLKNISSNKNIIITDPLGYVDFISLVSKSKLVVTDSGGIQEETTFLKIPCITMRNNTERPITVKVGSNYVVGSDVNNVLKYAEDILSGKMKKSKIPKYWDGKTAARIVTHFKRILN